VSHSSEIWESDELLSSFLVLLEQENTPSKYVVFI
jgi:hypothetical protein